MRQKVGLVLLVGGTLSVTSRLFVRLPFWESLSHETSRAALLLSTQPQAPQHITAGKSHLSPLDERSRINQVTLLGWASAPGRRDRDETVT